MMKNNMTRVAALCSLSLSLSFGGQERKISLFTAFDLGRVEDGFDMQYQSNGDGTVLNRTYVDVGLVQQLDEHYQINIGVGGIFWKAYAPGAEGPDEKTIKFGPGISNASMKWAPTQNLSLDFGYFPYKYNEAAKNLGEYLFRSEAYPTILYTGGWSWMNDVQYRTVGLKLTWNSAGGTFKQDFCLFGEYFNSPIYDITPAYVATWKPVKGFTLGGAGSLHRILSPTHGTRKELTRSYDYYKDFYFPTLPNVGRFSVIQDSNHFVSTYDGNYGASVDTLAVQNAIWNRDSSNLIGFYGLSSASQIQIRQDTLLKKMRASFVDSRLKDDIELDYKNNGSDSATYFGDSNNVNKQAQSVSFDLACVMLAAFFELDFNQLLGLDAEKTGQFNLYGEVAQLGLKNYPIFYTEYAQRRPIMVGLSVPTFGLLRHLSLELEYLKNPNIQSIGSTFDKLDLTPDQSFRYKVYSRDDVKWTLHASRGLTKFLSLYVQVANDHLRLKDKYARPEYIPMTSNPSNWYWLTRIQWYL